MPTSRIQCWFIDSLGSSSEGTLPHHRYECPRMFRNRARDIWELFLGIYVSDFELRGRQIFKLAILTISDTGSKGEREDTSGDAISKIMADAGGFEEVARENGLHARYLGTLWSFLSGSDASFLRGDDECHQPWRACGSGGTGLSP